MKIMCKWCMGSKVCHIVSKKITDYDGEHGTDRVTMAKIKIHKHHKGKIHCKGSDKIITVCLEDAEYQKGFEK